MLKIVSLIILLTIAIAVTIVFLSQASEKWSAGEVIRTPDSAFENLKDYPCFYSCVCSSSAFGLTASVV